jgi:hypothetical protein
VSRTARTVTRPSASRETTAGAAGAGGPSNAKGASRTGVGFASPPDGFAPDRIAADGVAADGGGAGGGSDVVGAGPVGADAVGSDGVAAGATGSDATVSCSIASVAVVCEARARSADAVCPATVNAGAARAATAATARTRNQKVRRTVAMECNRWHRPGRPQPAFGLIRHPSRHQTLRTCFRCRIPPRMHGVGCTAGRERA